jgi:hypothetical protein
MATHGNVKIPDDKQFINSTDIENQIHYFQVFHKSECSFNSRNGRHASLLQTHWPIFNSIQFSIINVPCQQLQRQLQTQHSAHIGNTI